MKRKRHWSSYTAETRVRPAILRRDNYECQLRYPGICLGTARTVDHIHPKLWGGLDVASNLRAACKPCNQFKGTKTDEQVAVLLRQRGVTPRAAPSTLSFFRGASHRNSNRQHPGTIGLCARVKFIDIG